MGIESAEKELERRRRTENVAMVLRPSEDFGAGGYADNCYPQTVVGGGDVGGGGGHHFYESIKTGLESFRLQGGADNEFSATAADLLLNDDTSSISSKKRIDSMFKTTAAASVAGDERKTSDGGGGGGGCGVANRRVKSLADDDRYRSRDGGGDYFDYGYGAADGENKNTVQEKIEKMFAEISSSELDTDASMDSAAAAAAVAPTGGNKYHVQYIGCADLAGKISSLEGLQQPVRDMYFEYREHRRRRHELSGLLEISAAGLTIRYKDGLGDTVHRTDPFPSIAVWAALKYVCRRRTRGPSTSAAYATRAAADYEYAFLPLIADPDGSDKAPLFRHLDPDDRARLDAAGDHAPVFAVVTRKAGKRLECHGFACETENDALLMAANLYGALVAVMSSAVGPATGDDGGATERQAAGPAGRRVIRQRNGFTSMSSAAGSSVGGGDVAPALPPPRPPRRNKKSVSSTASSSGDVPSAIALLADDGAGVVCGDAKTFRMTVRQSPSLRRGVCNSSSVAGAVPRSPSARGAELEDVKLHAPRTGGGDILTKVAIPRSRSFLGLQSSKYSRRAAGSGIETAADCRRRRRSNGSGVMGFSDMFNELRLQEGLTNMDEILNAIINVEGMSYNNLKPIYREFLMKLTMTLTKDELYQRTKAIMTEQKRKRNNRRPTAVPSAAGRSRRLNEKLRDALSLRAAKSRIGTVLQIPDFCGKRTKRKPTSRKQPRRCVCSGSANGSLSSCCTGIWPADRKPHDRKEQRRTGKRTTAPALRVRRQAAVPSPVCSTSDESEFFLAAALRRRQHQLHQQQQQQLLLPPQQQQQKQLYRKSKSRGSKIGRGSVSGGGEGGRGTATAPEGGCLHRASSGYFSCSECSAADDKCYCCGGDGDSAEPASLVSCSCDSDSCADSDKCYCGRSRRPRNMLDELKCRGFAASESSVSRADSPGTAWKKNELLMLQQQRHDDDDNGGPGGSSSAATRGGGCGGGGGGIESSKSIEYLQVARRPVVDLLQQHYSSVAKHVPDRMSVYGASTSPSSSLSAATVYSSSSAIAHAHRRQQQRRSGSSGSDNFHAIDYALFANNGGAAAAAAAAAARKSRGAKRQDHYRGTARGQPAAAMNRRSFSSEAVHLSGGCLVYHQQTNNKTPAARRHSVHDDGPSSFFRSDIENSLGYYP